MCIKSFRELNLVVVGHIHSRVIVMFDSSQCSVNGDGVSVGDQKDNGGPSSRPLLIHETS